MKVNKLYIYVVFAIISLVMIIMNFSVFPFSKLMFLIDFCITLVMIISGFIIIKNHTNYILSISKCVNSFLSEKGGRILGAIPVALAVTSERSGKDIVSYNNTFRDKILGSEDSRTRSIDEFLPASFSKNDLFTCGVQMTYQGRKFVIHCREFEDFKIFYFFDNTEFKSLKRKYLESKISIGFAVFDNKEELYQIVGEDRGLGLLVSVENILSDWMESVGGVFKKLSDGKFLLLFEEKDLRGFINQKFDIINKFHEVKLDAHRFATVSLGISRGASNLEESKLWAENALNMALGRGGDQVVLKTGSSYEFFGGSSKGLEKRSKVRTRIVANSLMEKIQACDKVFIMGHRLSDFDSVGACIGLWSVCLKVCKKPVYIVLDSANSMALPLLENVKKYGCPSAIISPQEAVSKVTGNSFLIVVDTHSEKFLESYKLYTMFKNTAIIDHHRMTVDKLKSADIFFHEPFASSTCEMVTELIQYMGDKYLKKWEAECLLAGIMLDTKSFSLKAGVRTFEAAAYLKKKGADSSEVKKMFADPMDIYKIKCKIIGEAYVTKGFAIAKCEEISDISRISSVQAADELLEIKDIRASFVIYASLDGVNISARSLGDVNVQVIMESLGGGGHQTMAAAYMPNVSVKEAEEKLNEIISANF